MADAFIGEKWKLPYTAQQLQDAATNQIPRISSTTGNWEVWDISTSAWVDTGVSADASETKCNNTNIAPVEATSTASQAYAVNSFLVYNGQFYRVTAAIAQGDTLTVGTNIVADSVGAELISKTPVIGKGINLLDNWYFPNPVNQRGLTTYTSTGYGIDRWVVNGITLSGGDIEATAAGSFMFQRLDNTLKSELAGKTITFSALTSVGLVSGSAVYQSAPASNIVFYNDADITLYVNTVGEFGIYFTTTAKKVSAVKLELGSEQTLARNIGTDANPQGVLNDPPPNFAEELAKCKRYQEYGEVAVTSSNRTDMYCITQGIQYTVQKRATPTITLYGSLGMSGDVGKVYNAGAGLMQAATAAPLLGFGFTVILDSGEVGTANTTYRVGYLADANL